MEETQADAIGDGVGAGEELDGDFFLELGAGETVGDEGLEHVLRYRYLFGRGGLFQGGRGGGMEEVKAAVDNGCCMSFMGYLVSRLFAKDRKKPIRMGTDWTITYSMIAPNPALSPALGSNMLNGHLSNTLKKKWWLLRRYIHGNVASLILSTSFISLSLAM